MDAQQATVSAVELRARSSWEPPPHQGQLTSGFLPALLVTILNGMMPTACAG